MNRNLATEVSKLFNSTWIPGQRFCELHYALTIPETRNYQKFLHEISDIKISETTGLKTNINDNLHSNP